MADFKGFDEEVSQALTRASKSARGMVRPVAVFDFDNTCIVGDIGELYGAYLVDEMLYRWDLEAFWQTIDPRDGRARIRDKVESLRALDPEHRASTELYESYRADLKAVYGRRLAREGKADTYAWAPRLHVGMSEHDMALFSKRAFDRELRTPMHQEVLRGETDEVVVSRGIRLVDEIRRAMRDLERLGFEVWIVSATNWWTVAACAVYFGIRPERVVGNRVEVEARQLTDSLVEPALFQEGKVAAIEREVGHRPSIVFGDSETDEAMLEWASHAAIVIDAGSTEFIERARRRGWPVQSQESLTHVERFE